MVVLVMSLFTAYLVEYYGRDNWAKNSFYWIIEMLIRRRWEGFFIGWFSLCFFFFCFWGSVVQLHARRTSPTLDQVLSSQILKALVERAPTALLGSPFLCYTALWKSHSSCPAWASQGYICAPCYIIAVMRRDWNSGCNVFVTPFRYLQFVTGTSLKVLFISSNEQFLSLES